MNLTSKLQISAMCLCGVLLSGCGCKQIPPGTVGIKFDGASGIQQAVIQPRVEWYGLYEKLYTYPTSIHNATFVRNASEGTRGQDESIQASTVEGATLPVDLTVAYHVDPGDVQKAFDSFGDSSMRDIERDYVRWVAVYGINVASGTRSIFDLISKQRAEFAVKVKEIISPILLEWGITVDDVLIGEIYPSKEVETKIQESIAVRTQLETVKTTLQKTRVDALTILTNAKKEAELNRLLSLQQERAIELKRLELRQKAIQKWDGVAPLIGDGTIPFSNTGVK